MCGVHYPRVTINEQSEVKLSELECSLLETINQEIEYSDDDNSSN